MPAWKALTSPRPPNYRNSYSQLFCKATLLLLKVKTTACSQSELRAQILLLIELVLQTALFPRETVYPSQGLKLLGAQGIWILPCMLDR